MIMRLYFCYGRVMWIGYFVLNLITYLSVVDCHPKVHLNSNCNERNEACQSANNEQEMHPYYEPLKRMKRSHPIDERFTVNGDYHDESSSLFWQSRAQLTLRNHLIKERNVNIAKNIIFFLGDGMSIPTLTAARIYLGQNRGSNGEESRLSFETFPYTGLSKTYCVDKQVPDSACSGTAYLCGVKGNFQTIGTNARVKVNDCKASKESSNQVHSLAALALEEGKSAGLVTTTTVTHASPAAVYAHVSNRNFECDADVVAFGQDSNQCEDIASQLINNKPGKRLKVVFGGGHTKFLPNNVNDTDDNPGERKDARNLVEEWLSDKPKGKFISRKEELDSLNLEEIDQVLGLFSSGHMDFNLDADRTQQPTLIEMTEAAIKILQKEENGFFLFVEGGRIDHGHHYAQAMKALDETVQFSNAVKRAVELTSREDTLIVVTSDHAHTMSISGYPDRGNPIGGLNSIVSEVDKLPTTTLSYANGPGYRLIFNPDGSRKNLTEIEFQSNSIYPGLFPSLAETHGGDDVAVFALGCNSHLFSGVYEQNTIPHIVSYAACLGNGLTACNELD